MKNGTKRLLKAMVAGLMLISLLTGCAVSRESTQESTTTTADSLEEVLRNLHEIPWDGESIIGVVDLTDPTIVQTKQVKLDEGKLYCFAIRLCSSDIFPNPEGSDDSTAESFVSLFLPNKLEKDSENKVVAMIGQDIGSDPYTGEVNLEVDRDVEVTNAGGYTFLWTGESFTYRLKPYFFASADNDANYIVANPHWTEDCGDSGIVAYFFTAQQQ